MKIIEDRDARLIKRKIRKQEYDQIIKLSADTGETVRLLDEGMVVEGDGTPACYIMKGTLEKFYNELPDDYEGSINVGHTDLAHFPDRIIGKWNKADLTLTDNGDGRKGLDVKLRLNEKHPLTVALRMADFDLAVSAELTGTVNTEISDQYGLEFLDSVFIHDFAIVGDPKNVNSTMKLGGDMKIKDLFANIGSNDDLKAVNDKIDEMLSSEEKAKDEEKKDEEKEEELSLEEVGRKVDELLARVTELEEANAALEDENKSLKSDMAAQEEAERRFLEKFSKLGASLSTERKEPEKQSKASFTDGFGG